MVSTPSGSSEDDLTLDDCSAPLRGAYARAPQDGDRDRDTPSKERYLERDRLGQGGMGEVVLVHDTLIGRDIALKRLRQDTPQARHRFAREARIQGQLEHPAVAPVYDLSTGGGAPYFTMKRVRGVSLRSVLQSLIAKDGSAATFSRRRLLTAFSQVCLAVHYAHERGVVHRDIKPENVMLGDYGEVYLLDWGIAKLQKLAGGHEGSVEPDDGDVHTRAGELVGTLAYMAPEQALSSIGKVDARTDVYALGALLFEILTLKRLHERAPLAVMMQRVVRGIDARASVRAPEVEVPPELEAACVAATRRQPAERLASARVLHEAIERYLDGDRDAELRLASARKHAESAQAAAEQAFAAAPASDEGALRGEALREVGKALALDASNPDALRTLVSLLTTPPRVVPEDVERERRATQHAVMRRAALLGAMVYVYILCNIFIVYGNGAIKSWAGVLPAQLLWLAAALASGVTALRPSYAGLFAMLVFGTAASVETTRILSPLLIVPGILAAHAVLYSLMRGIPQRIAVIAIVVVGWTVASFGEALGLYPRTIGAGSDGLFLYSTVVDLPNVFNASMIWYSFLALIVLPAILVGAVRSAYARADLQVRLQSWQLRQLLLVGSETKKVVPRPGVLSTQMRPPWSSTICRQMNSPRPEPRPPCQYRSKMRSRSSGAMPGPVSVTEKVTVPSTRLRRSRICPGGEVNLMALSSRLVRT
jgi:eukaryotic-like serine/threonine-protein kinase